VLLKNAHLLCCVANRTAQCISIYASRFGFLRALHLNIFEQPRYSSFPKILIFQDLTPIPLRLNCSKRSKL
jgi:hypothetical protein